MSDPEWTKDKKRTQVAADAVGRMTTKTLTSAEATRAGWTLTRSPANRPQWVSPEGRVYAKCVAGMPADVVIGEHRLRWILDTGALLRAMCAANHSLRGPIR